MLISAVFLAPYLISHISSPIANAQTAPDDLQAKIDQRNADIQALEAEIKGYQKQIDSLGTQELSLAATIKSLDLTQKKLAADIKVTEDKVAAKSLEIQQLGKAITGKESDIADDHRVIGSAFASMNEFADTSVIELLMTSRSLSAAWDSLDQLASLEGSVGKRIRILHSDESRLQTNKAASEKAKADLVALNSQLQDQKKVVLATSAEKSGLLSQTKQSEASYRATLAKKKALQAQFQAEVSGYESQLHLGVDSSALPATGSGVLSWPLAKIIVTQYFGNTDFSTANPQIYNGKGHTGIDFGASIGTPVMAALSGTVTGVANTDLIPGCYSYGKWIMVKHADGLSTLYAHLSVQSVAKGDQVSTGDIIGYSGNTGYTTGPHLHFGVYATQGVQIKLFDNSVNCKGAVIPLADFKAYLNPLSYLPKL